MAKEISKTKANEAAKIVTAYAKQEATKKGKSTVAATKKIAKSGFASLKSLFKK